MRPFRNMFKRAADHLAGKRKAAQKKRSKQEQGILVFENTSEVIRAENILKENGIAVQVMGPPPGIRSGCDLVIEYPLIEELTITRLLKHSGNAPMEIVPIQDPLLQPVNIYQVKDFGRHLMVRAANMKLTIDKETQAIVNISGGGCPDVPYLAQEMIGKTLSEAPQPREIGHTLCGYALQLAYEEMKRSPRKP